MRFAGLVLTCMSMAKRMPTNSFTVNLSKSRRYTDRQTCRHTSRAMRSQQPTAHSSGSSSILRPRSFLASELPSSRNSTGVTVQNLP